MSNESLTELCRRLGGDESLSFTDELERVQRRSSARLGRGIRSQMVAKMIASQDEHHHTDGGNARQ